MLRRLRKALRAASEARFRRNRRRFTPSISSTQLERRLVLSGQSRRELAELAGTPALIGQVTPRANGLDTSPAGLLVAAQYRLILLRSPQPAEISGWVGRL